MSEVVDLGTYRARLITDLVEAAELSDYWLSQQHRWGVRHGQQHLEWFKLRDDVAQQSETPAIVVLYRGAAPVGIAPFVLRSVRWRCKLGYRSILTFPIRQAHIFGDGFLLPPDAGAYGAVLRALARASINCDMVFLECVSTDSILWQVISASSELAMEYWKYTPDGLVPHRTIEVSGSFEEYLKSLSRKDRWSIGHPQKRFDEAFRGRWDVERVTEPAQVQHYIADVDEISRTSWQGRQLGKQLLQTAPRQRYLEACGRLGWLRCYVLHCDGRPIVFLEGLQPGSVYLPEETGYVPDWSQHQAGKVLFYRAIEDLFQWKPPNSVDFGYGESNYKSQFSNRTGEQVNVYLFRRSMHSAIALASHVAFARLMRLGRRTLDLLGKREAARKILRGA